MVECYAGFLKPSIYEYISMIDAIEEPWILL